MAMTLRNAIRTVGAAGLALSLAAGSCCRPRPHHRILGRKLPGRAEENLFRALRPEAGKPVLDESWDGGIGVIAAKVKAGDAELGCGPGRDRGT